MYLSKCKQILAGANFPRENIYLALYITHMHFMVSFFNRIQACIDIDYLKKLPETYKDDMETWEEPAKQAFHNLIFASKETMKSDDFIFQCVGDIPQTSPIDKIVMKVMRNAYVTAILENKNFVENCKKFSLSDETKEDKFEMQNCFAGFFLSASLLLVSTNVRDMYTREMVRFWNEMIKMEHCSLYQLLTIIFLLNMYTESEILKTKIVQECTLSLKNLPQDVQTTVLNFVQHRLQTLREKQKAQEEQEEQEFMSDATTSNFNYQKSMQDLDIMQNNCAIVQGILKNGAMDIAGGTGIAQNPYLI
jgi:hypothetical protein